MKILIKNMTKQKNAIVVGCGDLGSRISGELSLDEWNVTVLDISRKAFRSLPPYFGGETLTSHATDLEKLEEAGIKGANLFIAATDSDDVNVTAALIAKNEYGVNEVMARVRNADKADLLKLFNITAICPPSLSIREMKSALGGRDEK